MSSLRVEDREEWPTLSLITHYYPIFWRGKLRLRFVYSFGLRPHWLRSHPSSGPLIPKPGSFPPHHQVGSVPIPRVPESVLSTGRLSPRRKLCQFHQVSIKYFATKSMEFLKKGIKQDPCPQESVVVYRRPVYLGMGWTFIRATQGQRRGHLWGVDR